MNCSTLRERLQWTEWRCPAADNEMGRQLCLAADSGQLLDTKVALGQTLTCFQDRRRPPSPKGDGL